MQAVSFWKRPVRGAGDWLAVAIFCFAAGCGVCWGMGADLHDETWFLQVVHRMLSGQRLYRDVCFEPTPLSAYAGAFACSLFGVQILVTKVLLAVFFSCTAVLCVLTLSRCRAVSRIETVLICAFLTVHAPAFPNSLYNPLAMVFFVACLERCTAWTRSGLAQKHGGGRMLSAAGIAAGLCAATKQNLGALALAAGCAAVIENAVSARRPFPAAFRQLVRFVSPFAAVVILAVVLPVAVSGGWNSFVYHGFASKRTYLEAAVPFTGQIQRILSLCAHPSGKHLREAYFLLPWLLPVVVLPGLLIAWRRSGNADRRSAAVLFFFAGFGFLGAYPRYDHFHFCVIIPCLVPGLFWLATRVGPSLPRGLRIAVLAVFLTGLAYGAFRMASVTARSAFGRYSCLSDLPHLKYIPFRSDEYRGVRRTADELAKLAPDKKVFILGVWSGFYSLAAGLDNPTPYDYPITTILGPAGEKEIRSGIETDRIRTVVIQPAHPAWGILWPSDLEEFIRLRMEKFADLENGEAFRNRSAPVVTPDAEGAPGPRLE
jgi:hypothetical protein